MRKLELIAALWLMISTSAVAFANSGETLDLGPASVSLNLGSIGSYDVETEDLSSSDHNYDPMSSDFQYTIYPAYIRCDDSSGRLQIEIHQMSLPEPLDTPISKRDTSTGLEHCIKEAFMMPHGADVQTEPYTIDGQEGILATVDRGEDDRMYIVAYSPDQEEGSGTIVCVVGSSFPWEITEGIFASIKTQLA